MYVMGNRALSKVGGKHDNMGVGRPWRGMKLQVFAWWECRGLLGG